MRLFLRVWDVQKLERNVQKLNGQGRGVGDGCPTAS